MTWFMEPWSELHQTGARPAMTEQALRDELVAVREVAAAAVKAMSCARYDCPDCKAVRDRWRELGGES